MTEGKEAVCCFYGLGEKFMIKLIEGYIEPPKDIWSENTFTWRYQGYFYRDANAYVQVNRSCITVLLLE